MKATIKQAETNRRSLTITKTGYGHYLITATIYGKRLSCITTNTEAIDNYQSEPGEKKEGRNRIKQGYQSLLSEIIRTHKAKR